MKVRYSEKAVMIIDLDAPATDLLLVTSSSHSAAPL